MDPTTLFLGMLFGSFGLGYLVYGRKQQKAVAFLSGVGLCACPYFIADPLGLCLLGLLLLIAPFLLRV
jgi:hypothetical protein